MPLLVNIVLKVPARAFGQEKEIKDIQIRKKENLFLFSEDMILYIENPKESKRKVLELISELCKVAVYKIKVKVNFTSP